MSRASARVWLLGLSAGIGVAVACFTEAAAQALYPPARQQVTSIGGKKPGMGKSISSSIKKGLENLGKIVKPQPRVEPVDDPVSLATKAEPGVDLHVAVAQLYQESGKLREANEHYQKALRRAPNHLPALLGYARLKDRLGEPNEAKELYLKAAKAHPKEASVYNNIGLFYAGHNMFNESASAFARAVQLQPKNPKYRNNFATLLVAVGRPREALAHLGAVHRPAVAHYNLGYLLEQRGQLQAAAEQFTFALRADSSLGPATRALQRLQRAAVRSQRTDPRVEPGARLSRRADRQGVPAVQQNRLDPALRPRSLQSAPIWTPPRNGAEAGDAPAADLPPSEVAPLPPGGSAPTRLPPTSRGWTENPTPAPLPPRSSQRQPTPAAPLPPASAEGAELQHLPRIN